MVIYFGEKYNIIVTLTKAMRKYKERKKVLVELFIPYSYDN